MGGGSPRNTPYTGEGPVAKYLHGLKAPRGSAETAALDPSVGPGMFFLLVIFGFDFLIDIIPLGNELFPFVR